MSVEKIVNGVCSQVSSAAPKEGAKLIHGTAKLQEETPEKLVSALDGLASANKTLVHKESFADYLKKIKTVAEAHAEQEKKIAGTRKMLEKMQGEYIAELKKTTL